jgi:hypothetical protein
MLIDFLERFPVLIVSVFVFVVFAWHVFERRNDPPPPPPGWPPRI